MFLARSRVANAPAFLPSFLPSSRHPAFLEIVSILLFYEICINNWIILLKLVKIRVPRFVLLTYTCKLVKIHYPLISTLYCYVLIRIWKKFLKISRMALRLNPPESCYTLYDDEFFSFSLYVDTFYKSDGPNVMKFLEISRKLSINYENFEDI